MVGRSYADAVSATDRVILVVALFLGLLAFAAVLRHLAGKSRATTGSLGFATVPKRAYVVAQAPDGWYLLDPGEHGALVRREPLRVVLDLRNSLAVVHLLLPPSDVASPVRLAATLDLRVPGELDRSQFIDTFGPLWITAAEVLTERVGELTYGQALLGTDEFRRRLATAYAGVGLVREVRGVTAYGVDGQHWGHDPVCFIQ